MQKVITLIGFLSELGALEIVYVYNCVAKNKYHRDALVTKKWVFEGIDI